MAGRLIFFLFAVLVHVVLSSAVSSAQEVHYYPIPPGSHPHDVAPAPDGTVWYTAQAAASAGRLDPATGKVEIVPLGKGSAPHGIIIGPDRAAWITDGGLNAIVRIDTKTKAINRYPLPDSAEYANLNTATFDPKGILWFTGQSGVYGRLDPKTAQVQMFEAPRGAGPYGITTTPDGDVYYASLAGNYIARIDTITGRAQVIQPPTTNQGARRVWSDSRGRVWVSEWNAGQVSVYDPKTGKWKSWKLPGKSPRAYAVYVDEKDEVWLTDFGANTIVRFEPKTETFTSFPSDRDQAAVRELQGRPGEVWGAESGNDRLVEINTKP